MNNHKISRRFYIKRAITKYKISWFTLEETAEVQFPNGTVFLGVIETQTTDYLTRPNIIAKVGVALVPQEDD